jgi:hypothetical protein
MVSTSASVDGKTPSTSFPNSTAILSFSALNCQRGFDSGVSSAAMICIQSFLAFWIALWEKSNC